MTETIHFQLEATRELAAWARRSLDEADSPFQAAQVIVERLGAHLVGRQAQFGFWAPELVEQGIPAEQIFLEVLTPLDHIDLEIRDQVIHFTRQLLPLLREGDYFWGVYSGMQPGSRDQFGCFYWIKFQDEAGDWLLIPDPLAYSLPFGSFAPAEFYDIRRLNLERADREHFSNLKTIPDADGVPRVQPLVNILQLHVGTASSEGTLAGLAKIYHMIAEKRRAGRPLTLYEQNYIGYAALQLMPIEPVIEYEAGPEFWQPLDDDPTGHEVSVQLHHPDMTNWGYDIVIAGSPAVNPVLLGSKRPDELVDLINELHNFPDGPIGIIFDIVFGHADNQALGLLNRHFFTGLNMYGQDLNFRHPVVRAILLEMQRRKNNYGVDGVRVDGAQDFKYWDEAAQKLTHDDEYLELMNKVVQEVAGIRYRPWMIFEDGRPWPRDDWELASSYREVTRQFENVFQWGPLTFAHNTPFLFTFWVTKWWRIKEIAQVGSHWITGCANHDTLRRGTQVDPTARINTYLGTTLPEIFKNAYDNPAANLFNYVCMPGVPMDFINAAMRAPWGFIRNTDDRFGVKVVSEESRFLDWVMGENRFAQDFIFSRLKHLGFTDLDELRRFLKALDHATQLTDYDLEAMVKLMESLEPALAGPLLSVTALKEFARAWMDDVYDICNVSHYTNELIVERTAFNLAVRQFRRARPWLMADLRSDEVFDFQQPCAGTVLFYGLRCSPDGKEQILFAANMEGAPVTLQISELPIPGLSTDGWQISLLVPGLVIDSPEEMITLKDSQGFVLTR
jgi:hypothetical protein